MGVIGGSANGNRGRLVPTGTVLPYGGKSAPYGWLLCDGATYSASQYPELYSVIGNSFGGSDGSEFAVPNLTSKYICGTSSARPIGTETGSESFKIGYNNLPSDLPFATYQTQFKAALAAPDAPALYGVNNQIVGGGEEISKLPPSVALNYIIKY